MLYTWRLWTRFKVNTFFFSLCIENHIYRQDRWDERRNFFHWQRKRFSYSGINHTFQPSKSQSLKQFWKINHVLLGFVFLSVVNLKKKYVKKTVNSRNNFSHRLFDFPWKVWVIGSQLCTYTRTYIHTSIHTNTYIHNTCYIPEGFEPDSR